MAEAPKARDINAQIRYTMSSSRQQPRSIVVLRTTLLCAVGTTSQAFAATPT